MSFVALFWAGVVFPQFSLSGRIKDDSGKPLAGANVVLAGTYLGTVSDEEGGFYFSHLPSGTYRLRVSFIGYETFEKIVELSKDTEIEVILEASPILADEVVVSGVRAGSEIPVTFTNVTRQELEQRNLGQDIPFLLKSLPSVVVTSDAGAGVGYTAFRIRGTDLTRINVTMNGIPLNDSESHGVWWVDLPDLASSVSDIQVQRGVGTSTNGAGAFGASVNLRTFSLEKKPYAEWSGAGGSFNTFKNTLRAGTGLMNDRFTFDVRLSKVVSDGYIDRAWSDLSSLALTGAWYSKKKDILRLVVMKGKEQTYQAWDGVPGYMLSVNRRYNGIGAYTDEEGNVHYYDNETDNYWQDHLQLFYSKEFSRPLWLNLAVHYTKGKGYYEQYKEDQDLSDYRLEDVILPAGDTIATTDLIRRKWLNNDFYGIIGNLRWKHPLLTINVGGGWNHYDGGHYGTLIWARYFSNGEIRHRWYDNTGIKEDGNLYGKVDVALLPGLRLYGDMQLRGIAYAMSGEDDDHRDLTQRHHYLFFNPKGGMMYDLSRELSLYLSYAVAHREPARYDFKEAPADAPPRPEVLHDLEAGASLRRGRIALETVLYFMNYKDQLVMTGKINNVGIPIKTNVPRSYRLGIEMMVTAQITGDLSWQANATFSRNKILHFTEYVDDWDTWSQRSFYLGTTDLSFSPSVIANSTLRYRFLKKAEITWLARYVGKQYIDNTSSEDRKLDPYFVNDLIVSWNVPLKPFQRFEIKGMVNNLFNVKYETNAWVYQYYENNEHKVLDGYFPQAGIHFLAGLTVRF